MAAKVRLQRKGTKSKPFFRIVAIDSKKAQNGKEIEVIGLYNPTPNPSFLEIDEAKAKKWIACGAELSDRVVTLFKQKNLLS